MSYNNDSIIEAGPEFFGIIPNYDVYDEYDDENVSIITQQDVLSDKKTTLSQPQQNMEILSTEDKKEQIKNCFISKGILDYIPQYELQRMRFNLDRYIDGIAMNDNLVRWNRWDNLRRIYKNLKKKYEEAPKVLEKIIKKQVENPISLFNDQRFIYDEFLGHTGNPTWFPNAGRSPNPLGEVVMGHIQKTYRNPEGRIIDYNRLIEKIRDLLGCWILTISLLVPNIDYKTGGRKRKTNKRKTRKTNKKRTRKNKSRKFMK
jgi:hypothetical protein